MTALSAVIADDEEHIRTGINNLLKKLWPDLQIIGQAANGIDALTLIENAKPDMAFLDIQMPGLTGLQVAKQVFRTCKIVFITAYDHYAVQAFDSEAVDYILKPVSSDRFKITMDRLKKQLLQQTPPPASPLPTADQSIEKLIEILAQQKPPEHLNLIKVKTGSEIRFIPVSQILYFKAEDKYTIVQTLKKEFLIKTPIKNLETQLNPSQFQRVHRSSIVNMEKIRLIKRTFTQQMIICFEQCNHTIAVSRSYEHIFK